MPRTEKNNGLRKIILGVPILTAMLSSVSAQSVPEKPNVLFIAIDDLNDFPPFAGRYPDAQTPNMNRLAERGMVFTRAHAQFPLCGPSRASIMSGMYPTTLGIHNHVSGKVLQNLAKERGSDVLHAYFQGRGYKTMSVGKVYHGTPPGPSALDASGPIGKASDPTGRLRINWKQVGTQTDWGAAPEKDEELPDHMIAEWAVRQLGLNHEEPFLLSVGFHRPHVPWYVPQKWFDLYDKETLTLPPYKADDLDDISKESRPIGTTTGKGYPRTDWAINNGKFRDIVHAYLACISFVDHQVGKLLDALDASPYKENTIVVFWSDHGYHIGEKNTFRKRTLWERSSHVPLIIAGPGVEGGQRCGRVVGLVDIYPTLLDMCGLEPNPRNEGRSLMPLLKDPVKEWPYPAFTSYTKGSFAVQTERWRYIRQPDGSEELYDHKEDPNEWTNLANNAECRKIMDDLVKRVPRTIQTEENSEQ